MADIDFNTCSMRDVIARSVLLHPSVLADSMRQVQKIHHAAACTFTGKDTPAGRIAAQMRNLASGVANDIALDRLNIEALHPMALLMTFAAAAKLQCLTSAIVTSIAARGV